MQESFFAMDNKDAKSAIEAILFVSGEPVKISRLAAVLELSEDEIGRLADRLRGEYSFDRRGIRLLRLEDSLQLCSSSEFSEQIRRALETRKPPTLSGPALEVLAIVAYFQPVTRVYVEQIRGVDSAYTLSLLIERELVEACGRLAAPGRPLLYKTTHAFLRTFNLSSLEELPPLPNVENSGEDKEGIRNAILQLKAKEQGEQPPEGGIRLSGDVIAEIAAVGTEDGSI